VGNGFEAGRLRVPIPLGGIDDTVVAELSKPAQLMRGVLPQPAEQAGPVRHTMMDRVETRRLLVQMICW
jgi:hypothetical protein